MVCSVIGSVSSYLLFSFDLFTSASKTIDILEAYEGTLEDDYPPDNERCEHGEMLLYKVTLLHVEWYMVLNYWYLACF